jgi:hypothetical protein
MGGYLNQIQNYLMDEIGDAALVCMFVGAVAIIIKIIMLFVNKGKSLSLRASKAEYEKYSNLIRFQYGEKQQLCDLLDVLHGNIAQYSSRENLKDTYNAIIYIVLIAFLGWHSSSFVDYKSMLATNQNIENVSDTVTIDKNQEYKNMHFKLKVSSGPVQGPLSPYLKIEQGEYTAFQKPNDYKGNVFINNVVFSIIKPLKSDKDSIRYKLYFDISDESNKLLRYLDSSIVIGFYLRNSEMLNKNLAAKSNKLVLHFDGLLEYKNDTVPRKLRDETLGIIAHSAIDLKSLQN